MATKINFQPSQPYTVSFVSLGLGDGFFTAQGTLGIKTSGAYEGINALMFDRNGDIYTLELMDSEQVQPADIEITASQHAAAPAEDKAPLSPGETMRKEMGLTPGSAQPVCTDLITAEKELIRLFHSGAAGHGRILAIKSYRERCGVGLREAKDKTDEFLDTLRKPSPLKENW